MSDQNPFEHFRKLLIQDDEFRARFAENPAEALRAAGIDIPNNVQLPKIDKEDLDARVSKLKEEFGEALESSLFPSVSTERIVSNARLDNVVIPQIDRLGDLRRPLGRVYTISVCGTADW